MVIKKEQITEEQYDGLYQRMNSMKFLLGSSIHA
jgi:hypothetical protein